MRGSAREWLIAEIVVCFGPCALMLFMGMIFLPSSVAAMFREPLDWEGSVSLILLVVCGVVGLGTLVFVISQLFDGQEKFERPALVLGGVLAGAAPLLWQVVLALDGIPGPVIFTATVALPLLATVHILFLSRHLFVAGFRSGQPPMFGMGVWLSVALLGALGAFLIDLRGGLGSEALQERRAYWMMHKPAAYTYRSQVSGWLKPTAARYPKQIWVAGSEVTAANYSLSPGEVSRSRLPPPNEGALTIDQIFDAMLDAKKQGARVQARFDRSTGAVLHVRVDHVAEDADWGFEVREFRALDGGSLN
jgi:hypothetical protein